MLTWRTCRAKWWVVGRSSLPWVLVSHACSYAKNAETWPLLAWAASLGCVCCNQFEGQDISSPGFTSSSFESVDPWGPVVLCAAMQTYCVHGAMWAFGDSLMVLWGKGNQGKRRVLELFSTPWVSCLFVPDLEAPVYCQHPWSSNRLTS